MERLPQETITVPVLELDMALLLDMALPLLDTALLLDMALLEATDRLLRVLLLETTL